MTGKNSYLGKERGQESTAQERELPPQNACLDAAWDPKKTKSSWPSAGSLQAIWGNNFNIKRYVSLPDRRQVLNEELLQVLQYLKKKKKKSRSSSGWGMTASQGRLKLGSDGWVGFIEGEMEGSWRKRDSLSLRLTWGKRKWGTHSKALWLKQSFRRTVRNRAAELGWNEGLQPHQTPCPFYNLIMKITVHIL